MTWRLRIRHSTGFRYAGPVTASYNEARMTPLTTPGQTTLESRIEVSPTANVFRYWDYWGSQVTSFDVQEPHDELVVTATSVVETADGPDGDRDATWADLAATSVTDRFAELLSATRRTPADGDLAAVARDVAGSRPPDAAARAVAARVRAAMAYVPGATGVHTSAVEAWREGKGVCQDLAHVTLVMLRAVGIPARYVSGYLHPRPGAQPGETHAAESHAWVEWWAGGWHAFDPTNGVPAGRQHVIVGRGRDYGDVTPLKGIYSGPPSTQLGVTVEVTRLA